MHKTCRIPQYICRSVGFHYDFGGILAVSVSGRGYPVDGSFLMYRSTQPTDFRLSIHNRTVGAREPRPMVWGTYEWVGKPNPYERLCVCVVAVSGFTTILGDFSGIGIRARLSCGRVVLDVPFNPTYGFPPIHSQSNRRDEVSSPHGLGNVRMGWGTQPLRKIVRLCSCSVGFRYDFGGF